MHQDQVVELPKKATLYASSEFCDYAGFYINDHVLTIQAHPEFLVEFNKALLTIRSPSIIPSKFYISGVKDLDINYGQVDSDTFSQTMINFFLNHQ